MIGRRELLGGLAVASSILALPGCSGSPRHTFRFKMTVEVETPEGLKTGSSVMEISAAMASIKLPESQAVNLKFKGEAVAVDLPSGQTLFALVGMTPRGDTLSGDIIATLNPDIGPEEKLVAAVAKLEQPSSIGHTAVMNADGYPRLVRFRDIRDPKSVELVDPNDLGKSFGPGVTLKRIALTVVDEPVTVGIEKRLPTPQTKGFFNWDGDTSKAMPPGGWKKELIGIWDFSKGIEK
jgi:hypothetical protein